MTSNFKTSVKGAESWRIIVDNLQTRLPNSDNEVKFSKNINGILKVRYIISAITGTDVVITYECIDSAGKNYSDASKPSPHTKTIPGSNRTEITLNIK